MDKQYRGAVCVVAASLEAKMEYWVAATPPSEAVLAVQLILGLTWKVALTNRRRTSSQRAELNLRLDDVRRLPPLP
jgi:hypothetical protein